MKNKVMVVEDEYNVRFLYETHLQDIGLEVVAITDFFTPAEVEETFLSVRNELVAVISDGQLGDDLNGVDVVRIIRNLDSQILILAVTGDSKMGQEMLKAGASKFLLKSLGVFDNVVASIEVPPS